MSEQSAASTEDFLRKIWPAEGAHWYAIALKTKTGMHHEWFRSISDAASYAFTASRRGVEVYHACAVYREKGSRKAANAIGARAFWVDIDVGPAKAYISERDALRACFAFADAVGLPAPLVVHSGGGWHC